LTVHSLNDNGQKPYVLKVDNFARTIVADTTFVKESSANDDPPVLQLGAEYEICNVDKYFFQEGFSFPVRLKTPGPENDCTFQIEGGNPLVDISDDETLSEYNIIDLPDAATSEFYSIDDTVYENVYFDSYQAGNEFILDTTLTTSTCDALPDPWNNPDDSFPLVPIFGRSLIKGIFEYLLYDPRLMLLENTVENPLADGGGDVSINTNGATYCSNAPRTFLNEDYCVLSSETTACSAATFPTFTVKLDHEFLTGLYSLTGRYVYAVDNLPISDETYVDMGSGNIKRYIDLPCEYRKNRVARWMRVDISFCNGDFEDYSNVGNGTAAAFALLLEPGFEDPANPDPLLKDVFLSDTQSCDDDDGLKEELGYVWSKGVCWQHVHPQHLNVYDLTDWVGKHDGGAAKITKWAEMESSSLVFSNSTNHQAAGNYRFYEKIVWSPTTHRLLGKMDEFIPYSSLPPELQSPDIEQQFGAISVNPGGKGVVICGSLGEVANKPELGSGFDLNTDSEFDESTPNTYFVRQRNAIWSYLALTSKDQLRQRTAFALSQILVISPRILGDGINTETTIQYYDIFVRNAFGSYREILKQVAFSPRMGEMLSSLNSKSPQFSIDYGNPAFPDENFAREIMQLFSIGLDKLNMDGTRQMDDGGNPIPTYDNTDILSFARAWTGLQNQARRGNHESRVSRVEPMNIKG
jgi:hypothetical protein